MTGYSFEDLTLFGLTGFGALSGIFALYCIAQFQKHSNEDYFVKRGVQLEWSFLVSSFIAIAVLNPTIWMLAGFHVIEYAGNLRVRLSFGSLLVGNFSIIALICRVFLRYIHVRRNERALSWKQVLDINYSHWVLEYYHILGKPKKVLSIASILWIINALTGVYLYFIDNSMSLLDRAAMWLLTVIIPYLVILSIMIVLVCRAKAFQDYWMISKELKYIGYSQIILIVILAIVGFARQLDIISHDAVFLLNSLLLMVWIDVLWYLSTVWVINKMHPKKVDLSNKSSNNMVEFLSSEKGFEDLMNCCEKSFSSENLILLTVIIQWRDELYHKLKLLDSPNLVSREHVVTLPKNVPLSSIVQTSAKIARQASKQTIGSISEGSPRAAKWLRVKSNDKSKAQVHAIGGESVEIETMPAVGGAGRGAVGAESVSADGVNPPEVRRTGSASPVDPGTPQSPSVTDTTEMRQMPWPPTGVSLRRLRMNSGGSGADMHQVYYQIMVVFEAIYVKFIERNVAPMEVNIAHRLRETMKQHYVDINNLKKDNQVIDYKKFLEIWGDVREVSSNVYDNLYHTFLRSGVGANVHK